MEYPETARNVTGTHEKRRRWRRAVSVLACAVVFCTTYALILPAITLSAEPKCGLEEHTHTEDCYETRLVCGQTESGPETAPETAADPADGTAPESDPAPAEDSGDAPTPESVPEDAAPAESAHVHTEACYQQVLTCGKQEHTHTDACWSDPAAAEDPKDWEPEDLTGDWNRDTLAVALAQEGYRPSEDYFTVDDAGEHIGYTRYGDWSGDPFGEWNLSFAAFCLRFGGAAEEAFPAETTAESWRTALDARDLYQPLEGAEPGDLIFLDSDGDGEADRVGIFTGWREAESRDSAASAQPEERFAVMEGDLDGAAVQALYDPEDGALLGRASPNGAADAWYLCGGKAHVHGEDCYDGTGALTCGKTEHIHGEDCRFPESRSFAYQDDDLALTVTVLSPAPLPEDTELTVTEADASALAEEADTQEGGQWLLRGLALTRGGETLDTADCRITAQVTLRESVLAPLTAEAAVLAQDAAPEAEVGVLLSAWRVDEDAGVREVESVLLEDETTALTVPVEDGMLALYAGSTANPSYTVQYYANIPRFAGSGDKALTVIDTKNGLPDNTKAPDTKEIYLEQVAGRTTGKNNGDATQLYRVKTETKLTEMYTANEFQYITSPNPSYINKLIENPSYTLTQLWILKNGKDASSTSEADWDIYEDPSKVHFTNRNNVSGCVTLTDSTVIRLVYSTRETTEAFPADFYDYDITDGTTEQVTYNNSTQTAYHTGTRGINSSGNYGKSANGQRDYNSHRDVLAFGNDNTGTGMSRYKFAEVFLNKYSTNYKPKGSTAAVPIKDYNLYGCTFGLAKGLEKGKIVYNDWLVAPKLFNDGDAEGKTTYPSSDGSKLGFSRVGDTYTLSSATVASHGTIGELEYFFNPSPKSGCVWDGVHSGYSWQNNIFTNDFWPMDTVPARNRKDPLFGGNGQTKYYKGYEPFTYDGSDGTSETKWSDYISTLPDSDDGNDHNCFFGMRYAVTFELTSDYVGPLEYYFFGDDDMWVFLDNRLVCDIGGVHSAVGEYVDLWDYIDKGTAGTHTLSFFYTERGASGSTCYMNFTLPSVSGVTTQQKTGNLKVAKEVVGAAAENAEFNFTVNFTHSDGSANLDDFVYDRYDANGTLRESNLIVHDDGAFTLEAGEYVIIKYLPFGTRYTITESGNYTTVWRDGDGVTHSGATATGGIREDDPGNLSVVTFSNIFTQLNVRKVDPGSAPLIGAEFTLADSEGNKVAFTRDSDGTYTAYYENPNLSITDGDLYYIALASGESWVIGQNTGLDKFDAQLQARTGADAQKLRVYRQTDGTYSFQSVANKKWLDLDSGKLTNGTLVHFWENASTPTTHDNQKWYLYANSDGSYTIKPKVAVMNGSGAVLDLDNATVAEGQKIQAWESNNSNAQKWKLVPVDPAAKPDTTTILAVSGTGDSAAEDKGWLHLRGLTPGTYTLTETQVPDGYQDEGLAITLTVDRDGRITLGDGTPADAAKVTAEGNDVLLTVLNKPNAVTLTLEKKVVGLKTDQKFSFEIRYKDANGTLQTSYLSLGDDESDKVAGIPYGATVTITETNHAGFSVLYKNGDMLLANGETYTFTITRDVTITAENSTGYELPSTGGVGTGWFTLAGLLLMTGAVAALTISRRRAKEGGPE